MEHFKSHREHNIALSALRDSIEGGRPELGAVAVANRPRLHANERLPLQLVSMNLGPGMQLVTAAAALVLSI